MKSSDQLDKEIKAFISNPYLDEDADLEGVVTIDSRKLAYVAAEEAGYAPGALRLLTERNLGNGLKRWYFRRVHDV